MAQRQIEFVIFLSAKFHAGGVQLKWRFSKSRFSRRKELGTMKWFDAGFLLVLLAFLDSGCETSKLTEPPRSATEQLLLSTAADRALVSAGLTMFANRKVFLDTNYFDSYDSKYAVGTIRDALSRAGAILAPDAKSSDIIIEARSGALSIDGSETLVGIPTMGVPIPLVGALQIPELALYKSQRQSSYAKFALLAYAHQSGKHIYSSGPLDGKAFNKNYKLLFVSWISSDLPEKQIKQEKEKEFQRWHELYTQGNMPSTNAPPAVIFAPTR
jgi:hypothetical protein